MAEKYLYFRAVTTLADDDQGQDSVCYPLSKFRGFSMGTAGDSDATEDDDSFAMIFESLQNDTAGDDANFDIITIRTATNNNAKAVWKGLTEAFVLSEDVFLIVGDNVTGEFLHGDILRVGTITLVDAG